MRFMIAALLVLAPACKKSQDQAPAPNPPLASPAPTGAAPPPAPRPAATLSDAQIAAIVVAANQVDIEAGELARNKSTDAEVKKFAEQMVTDHTAVNKAAVELVTRLKVTPEESDASRALVKGGEDMRAKLGALEGAAFDRAYVDNEVAYHEAVIGVLDTQLIPSAGNAELAQTLVGVRPAFVAHLEHAKHLQSTLAAR